MAAFDVTHEPSIDDPSQIGHRRDHQTASGEEQGSYIPGLDGLRALAVLVVMVGHLLYGSLRYEPWLPGSWLGVSVFFTLSGFLITRLLLGERERRGHIDLGGFWSRRARRLLPALYASIVLMMVAVLTRQAPANPDMGTEVAGAVLYVKNLVVLYGDNPMEPSFGHLWSLSIEEQFYLVFPILFIAATALLRRRAVVAWGALWLASSLWIFRLSRIGSTDAGMHAYFGTPARAAEILGGVVLAYVVTSTSWSHVRARRWFRPTAQVAGVAALLLLAWLWRTAEQEVSTIDRNTLLTTIATVVLIMVCTTAGPVGTALSCRPLRWMGKRSYGAYLYHIAVFYVLDARFLHITSPIVLAAIQIPAAFLVADLSYRYLETPLRHRTTPRGWRLAAAYGSVGGLVIALAVTLPFPAFGNASVTDTARPAAASAPGPHATQVQVVGDESLQADLRGLRLLADDQPAKSSIEVLRLPACPLSGAMSLAIDGELRSPDGWCAIFHGSAGRVDPAPDVFVYELGAADLLDHQLPNGQVAHLGEAVADARLADQIDTLARGTDDGAATRVFVELPDDPQIVRLVRVDATKPTARTTHEQEREAAAVDPPTAAALRARIRRFNEILHEATERHDNVRVVPPLDDTPATWRAAIRAARD